MGDWLPGRRFGVLIATTAPGTNAQVFLPGNAMLIKVGSVLTFQVHYTVNGNPTKDRTSIGFVFAKQPPKHEVRSGAFTNTTFVIPPGDANHLVDSAIEFLQDTRILSIFPHTHLRAGFNLRVQEKLTKAKGMLPPTGLRGSLTPRDSGGSECFEPQ